jgi:hypothetical protein
MRFEALRERLLQGGIAPRHVRRYLRELEEHYADLYAAQREAGFEPKDADIRARALLGEDENLAQAMLQQRDFRSISARFPWLVFPLAPLPAVIAGLALPLLLLIGLSKLYGFWIDASEFVVPGWYRLLAQLLLGAAWFAVTPLATLALTIIICRQRLSLLWLLPCILLLLPLITDLHGDFPTAAEIRQHKGNYFSVGLGWAWGDWSTGGGQNWAILPGRLGKELASGIYWGLARQLLILAPPAVLLMMRWRKRLKEHTPAI